MSIGNDNRLTNLLSEGGFSEKEAEVLKELLKTPQLAAGAVAMRTKIKRPTVYAILNNLVSRGLINRVVRGGKTYFEAIPPDTFCEVVGERARREYEQKSDAMLGLKHLVDSLAKDSQQKAGGYTIKTLDNPELVFKKVGEVLEGGDFCSIYNPQVVLVGEPKEVVKEFFRKTSVTQPHIREVVVKGKMADWYSENIKNPNHKIKYVSTDTDIASDIFINQSSVLLVDYTDGAQHGISIEQSQFVRTMQAVFELMWGML